MKAALRDRKRARAQVMAKVMEAIGVPPSRRKSRGGGALREPLALPTPIRAEDMRAQVASEDVQQMFRS